MGKPHGGLAGVYRLLRQYAANLFSCGPSVERRDLTKQFYINMFLYDPVVLRL